MKTFIQRLCLFLLAINAYSFEPVKINKEKPTKIIIENTTNKPLKIQQEISSNLVFEGYNSTKVADTIILHSTTLFRIVCSSFDSTRQYVYTTFILNPGETIYLKKLPFNVIAFSNQGKKRNNELQFFVKMQEAMGNFEGLLAYIPHKRKETLALLQKVQDLYAQRLDFLDKYKENYIISKEFEESIKNTLFYQQYIEYLDYCNLDGVLGKNLLNSPDIKKFIDKFLLRKDEPNSIYYQKAMFGMAKLIYTENNNYISLYNNSKKHLKGKTLENVLYNTLSFNKNSPKIGELVKDFLSIGSSEALKKVVIENYGQNIESGLVIPIPNYNRDSTTLFYNLKTKEIVRWDDLIKIDGIKYVDFWATWCGGCRQALPFSKKLQQEYLQKGLKVIFISIDENASAWAKISRKEGLPDESSYLMLEPSETFIKLKYDISGIPRYMVIDKDGTIINAEAPIPLDRQVNKNLEDLLK